MRLSVTARIALLSTALALASSLIVLVLVWQQSQAAAIDAVRRTTVEQADELVAAYRTGGAAALESAVEDAGDRGDPTLAAMLVDRRGRQVTGVGPERLSVPLRRTRFAIARLGQGDGWDDVAAGYALRPVGARWLLIGRMLATVEQQQAALARVLVAALLVAVALGGVAGVVLARYVAARLVRVTAVIDAVGDGDLSRRVPLTARGGDAFDRLAARLNATLDRLERAIGELRVVTDGLAHDLRSPLARLRTKAEAAALADEAAREQALGGLIAETDLVMRMLTTSIEISRASQMVRDRFVPVDPRSLVEELADLYAPVAEEAGRAFDTLVEGDPAVRPLHRELMSQALANLIDNALNHASEGSVVLRLTTSPGELAFAVEDRGPGIAPEDRDAARRRFARLDSARSVPGAGLGMALVEAVARLHDGRLELDDNAPGLVARIVLPA